MITVHRGRSEAAGYIQGQNFCSTELKWAHLAKPVILPFCLFPGYVSFTPSYPPTIAGTKISRNIS